MDPPDPCDLLGCRFEPGQYWCVRCGLEGQGQDLECEVTQGSDLTERRCVGEEAWKPEHALARITAIIGRTETVPADTRALAIRKSQTLPLGPGLAERDLRALSGHVMVQAGAELDRPVRISWIAHELGVRARYIGAIQHRLHTSPVSALQYAGASADRLVSAGLIQQHTNEGSDGCMSSVKRALEKRPQGASPHSLGSSACIRWAVERGADEFVCRRVLGMEASTYVLACRALDGEGKSDARPKTVQDFAAMMGQHERWKNIDRVVPSSLETMHILARTRDRKVLKALKRPILPLVVLLYRERDGRDDVPELKLDIEMALRIPGFRLGSVPQIRGILRVVELFCTSEQYEQYTDIKN